MAFWTSERLKSEGDRLITPFHDDQVVNCAYEMTLGSDSYVTGSSERRRRSHKLKRSERLEIPPGQLAVLMTEEVVRIPPDAIGFISVKSRFKLHGLINVSGFHVDPGFDGHLLFSVYNAGGTTMVLSRGERLFLLWYSELQSATQDTYQGTRLEQTSIPNSDIMAIGRDQFSPAAINTRLAALESRLSLSLKVAFAVFAATATTLAVAIAFVLDKIWG